MKAAQTKSHRGETAAMTLPFMHTSTNNNSLCQPLDHDMTNAIHNVVSVNKPPANPSSSKNKKKNRKQHPSMEMTTTERLKACLKDNSMTDVALVGDDGIPIPAIRCVLGSASPVMKQLLYTTTSVRCFRRGGGNDSTMSSSSSSNSGSLTTVDEEGFVITLEPQKSLMVHIPGFRSKTIKALVEYCCSDGDLHQTCIFEHAVNKGKEATAWISRNPAQAVIEMLDFALMAIHYEIPKVPQQVVDDFVTPLTKRYPPLACIVYNYLLTVEFPEQPTHHHHHQQGAGADESSVSTPHSKSNNTSSSFPSSQETSNSSKEAHDAEKVVSAAAALTKLYTIALNIIQTQPYVALEPLLDKTSRGMETNQKDKATNTTNTNNNMTLQQPMGGVLSLHAETLGKLLQDREVEADELFLFCKLLRWHDHHVAQNIFQENSKMMMMTSTTEGTTMIDGANNMKQKPHKITATLQQLANGNGICEQDEDSFQFEANFDDFIISNADTPIDNNSHAGKVMKQQDNTENTWDDAVAAQNSYPLSSTDLEYLDSTLEEHYSCRNPTVVCQQLVQHLDLAAIDPIPLKDIVSTADFVDQKLILDALWEQAAAASKYGPMSLGSIIRGTGGPGISISGILTDLTQSQKQEGPPEHQYFKSHIRVQGAGIEECNGIYAQVMMNQPNLENKEKKMCGVKDYGTAGDSNGHLSTDLPTLMCSSSASSLSGSHTTSSDDTEVKTEVATGVCLRFIKETKRKNHKSKTWYLVCHREVVHSGVTNEVSPVPFHHQWSIIEEDNRGEGQLRVLYEWEQDDVLEDVSVPLGSLSRDLTSSLGSCFVIDSSTLQKFPENGWSSIEEKYSPAPICKWYRPRYGSPVLVVPGPAIVAVAHKQTEAKPPIKSKVVSLHSEAAPPLPPLSRQAERPAKGMSTDAIVVDSLFGLSILSSVSSYSGVEPIQKVNIKVRNTQEVFVHDANKKKKTTIPDHYISSSASSSTFRLAKARHRVSLADTSIDTSEDRQRSRVSLSTVPVSTYEI